MPDNNNRQFREGWENPYLPKRDQKKRYNYQILLDEAHQKWLTGDWRARSEDLSIDRREITADLDEIKRPGPERFKLDIKKDLMGGVISLKALSELEYSPQYRPRGKLDVDKSDPVAPRRYNLLAGLRDDPPENLDFLADAEARRKRQEAQYGAEEPGGDNSIEHKIRDSRRLEKSVAERRSELIKMLPDINTDETDRLINESITRQAREKGEPVEDLELRSTRRRGKRRKRFDPIIDEVRDEYARYSMSSGGRLDYLPEQHGMEENTRQLPEFESRTRRWNEINNLNPTWGEIVKITDASFPGEENEIDRTMPLYRPDARKKRREAPVNVEFSGVSQNDYLQHSGITPERVREIMRKEYRGRWIPPEMFNDDELVFEYFNQRSRGHVVGEDFLAWAQRQRAMADYLEDERRREKQHRLNRLKAPAAGRRGSPYARPARRDEHFPDMDEYEDARRQGENQGRQMRKEESRRIKKQRKKERAEQYRQYQQYQKQSQKQYQKQYQQYQQAMQNSYNDYYNNYYGYSGQYPGLFGEQSANNNQSGGGQRSRFNKKRR